MHAAMAPLRRPLGRYAVSARPWLHLLCAETEHEAGGIRASHDTGQGGYLGNTVASIAHRSGRC